jgi:spermidine synthase
MSLEPTAGVPTPTDSPQAAYTDGNGHTETRTSSEIGIRNAELIARTPHSALRTPNSISPAHLLTRSPTHPWAGLGLVFASTILVSAFLLFQVQPLISKYILPWFGGSPAVWTTCMLFFQVVLFGGYTYAHLLTRYLSPKGQGIVHLSLMALAIAIMLPSIAPAATWKPEGASHPTGRILLLLSATVGLPYFVLSTTGPLVQAWFARTWPGRSPYRLYALSNIGSLAALVTYPFVFEPAFGSDTQAGLWTAAFGLFAVLCGVSALWVFRLRRESGTTGEEAEADAAGVLVAPGQPATAAPSVGRRILWVTLPACASMMLLATTNYVCQDVAVMPFLWVVPLSLYLLTFIISFDHPRWYRPLPMSILALALLLLSAGAADDLISLLKIHTNYLHELALYFSTMFFACLICHGQLVRLRPDPKHLTEYYLLISAGGALGGIFVSLIAPQIFRTHFEWTLGLGASILLAGAVAIWEAKQRTKLAWREPWGLWAASGVVGLAAIGGIYWLARGAADNPRTVYEARNFYGTIAVLEYDRDNPAEHRRYFFSGGTVHGKQFVDPEKRHLPVSYFAPHTGIGRTLTYFQSQPDTRVGIIGMGVGVVAAYAKPGHYFRFYEINEEVADVARHYFTYLSDCEGKCDVILADGRLALEQELAHGEPQRFNVLVLDAFNGHAPPVHLLTDEAFQIYLQRLQPDGVIVVNVTNRYINLVPVVKAAAKKHGLGVTQVMTEYEPDKLYNRTHFMMLSKNQDFLAANPPVLIEEDVQPEFEVPLWTDQYSNLFTILKK